MLGRATGDMRIWRSRQRPNFDANDLSMLRMIMPAFGAALQRCRALCLPLETVEPIRVAPEFRWTPLTTREQDVARLAATGMSDKEIARRLNISFTTVRTHLDHVFRKLQASKRGQLAALLR